MGQSQKNSNKLVNQWTLVDTLGRFQIYKNQHNQLAQKHIVKVDPKIDQNDYLTAYNQRYLPDKPIVNAYDAQFTHKSKALCQNASTMTVFTEFIPHRLSDIQLLNHGQGIYVLSQALAGFAQLYRRVGPFQIHQDLIGFNQQGQVRVWHNPNFAQNSVDNDRIILMSTLNPYDFDRKFSQNQQHDMVQDTFNAVARYTKFDSYFLNQAQYITKMSFNEARQTITTQIARKAYYVPDHLFLTDKNNIIQKSGIVLKHKHVYNPNKPKKGQRYPYFMNQTGNYPQYQGGNYQDQYYNNYDNYYTNSDQTQSQSGYSNSYVNHQGGGYYNLNGQNYRVIAQKQIDSNNNLNQQQLINQALRGQGINYSYPQNQNYVQLRNGNHQNYNRHYPHYDKYTDASSQYSRSRVNEQREGHIVISDRAINNNKNRLVYYDQYGKHHLHHGANNPQSYPQQPQQEQVRVFSIDQNGRHIQENNYDRNQPHYRSIQNSQYPDQQSRVNTYGTNPLIINDYQINNQHNASGYGGHLSAQQGYRSNIHHQNIQPSISHRNKIFEQQQIFKQKQRVVIA